VRGPEEDSIYETVEAIKARKGFADDMLRANSRDFGHDYGAAEMTDLELDFAIFGVTVQ
jgi:hypothetical protein